MGNNRVRFGLVVVLALVGCASVAQAIDYRDPANLARLIEGHAVPYLLLDVRTPGEFAGGHIPTAVNIPYDRVADRMGSVAKGSLVIVYCASGHRASIAAETLAGLGFTNVTDFGALSTWTGRLTTGST